MWQIMNLERSEAFHETTSLGRWTGLLKNTVNTTALEGTNKCITRFMKKQKDAKETCHNAKWSSVCFILFSISGHLVHYGSYSKAVLIKHWYGHFHWKIHHCWHDLDCGAPSLHILKGFYAYKELYIESHNETVDLLLTFFCWNVQTFMLRALPGSDSAAVDFQIQLMLLKGAVKVDVAPSHKVRLDIDCCTPLVFKCSAVWWGGCKCQGYQRKAPRYWRATLLLRQRLLQGNVRTEMMLVHL